MTNFLIAMLALIGLLAPVAVIANRDPADFVRVLEQAGYTQVQPTGYRFLGCSDNDLFREGFRAVSPAGIPVSGVVCSSFIKGHTIRID